MPIRNELQYRAAATWLTSIGRIVLRWTHYPRFLEDVIRKKGYKWSWHNLRHRRASTWANSGMSTFEIQHRLGHTNIKTTMIYLQFLGFNGLGNMAKEGKKSTLFSK